MGDLRDEIRDWVEGSAPPVDSAEAVARAGRGGGRVGPGSRSGVPGRVLAGAALAAALVVGVVVVRSGDDGTDPEVETTTEVDRDPSATDRRVGGWTKLPESGLSPRQGATAIAVGDQVVVLGGHETPWCGPACDRVLQPPLQDGAVLDLATLGWRAMAAPPAPLGRTIEAVALDGVAYVTTGGLEAPDDAVFLAYHPAEDRWEELPLPAPVWPSSHLLEATADRVVAWTGEASAVQSYDPASRTWTQLPADPLAASYDRDLTWTGEQLVLTGIARDRAADEPPLYRAAVLDPAGGGWATLPTSEVVGHNPDWFATPMGLVNPTSGESDGGETNGWDRAYPHGGVLDPATGTWSALPDPPDGRGPLDLWMAGGERFLLVEGFLLDTTTGTWDELPPYDGETDGGQAATWAGDTLVLWGGHHATGELSADGWLWRPEASAGAGDGPTSTTASTSDPGGAPDEPTGSSSGSLPPEGSTTTPPGRTACSSSTEPPEGFELPTGGTAPPTTLAQDARNTWTPATSLPEGVAAFVRESLAGVCGLVLVPSDDLGGRATTGHVSGPVHGASVPALPTDPLQVTYSGSPSPPAGGGVSISTALASRPLDCDDQGVSAEPTTVRGAAGCLYAPERAVTFVRWQEDGFEVGVQAAPDLPVDALLAWIEGLVAHPI